MDLLWARIEGIVTKTIMAMAPMLSFELQRAFSVRLGEIWVIDGGASDCILIQPMRVFFFIRTTGQKHESASVSAAWL